MMHSKAQDALWREGWGSLENVTVPIVWKCKKCSGNKMFLEGNELLQGIYLTTKFKVGVSVPLAEAFAISCD